MAQYTVRDLIEVVYSDGKNTCFKLTEHTTAWVEDGLLGKRLILAWKVARDEEGLYEAVKSKGVVLHWHELDDLKDRIDDGSFGRAVELASIPGAKASRITLKGSILMKASLSIKNFPVYGTMVTFSKGEAFCKVGIKRVLKLFEVIGFNANIDQIRPPKFDRYQRQNGNQQTGDDVSYIVNELAGLTVGECNKKSLKTDICHLEGFPNERIYIEVVRRHPRSGYEDLGDGAELGLPDYYGWDYPEGGFDVVD